MKKISLMLFLLAGCVTHTVDTPDYFWWECNAHTYNTYDNPGFTEAFCYTTPDGVPGLLRRCAVDKDCPGEQVCRCFGGEVPCLIDFFVLKARTWFWGCTSLESEAYPYEL